MNPMHRLFCQTACASVLTLGSSLLPAHANELQSLLQQHWQAKQNQPVAKSPVERKVTGGLLDLVNTGAIPKNNSGDQAVLIAKGMAATEFLATAQQGEALEEFLRSRGVTIQSRVDDVVFGFASPSEIQTIVNSPLLASVRFQGIVRGQNNDVARLLQNLGVQSPAATDSTDSQGEPSPLNTASSNVSNNAILQAASRDEGVLASHAQLLHQRQLLGQGVKIGVIDFGYARYPELLQRGLAPTARQTRSFVQGASANQLNTASDASEHGTACAEIIYKMAPAAEYYLAQVGDGRGGAGDGDLMAAIDWMMQQGVNIINFSGGGHMAALDGTSALDRKVQQAIGRNILWVNAAGNEGRDHWSGLIQNRNQDQQIETRTNGNLLTIVKQQAGGVRIVVNWDDWYGSRHASQQIDVDAFLLRRGVNGQFEKVAEAVDARPPNSPAMEVMGGRLPAGTYYLALTSDKQSNRRVHVVVAGAELQQANAAGSIGVPATTEAALSVGAWDVREKRVAAYSSQGPTTDGRIKPDLIAPSGVLNAAYGYSNSRFDGTSAAAPYAAGFAAQLWAGNRSWSAAQLKSQIMQRFSTSLGGQAPSTAFGYGLIDGRKYLGSSAAMPASGTTPAPRPTPQASPTPNTGSGTGNSNPVADLMNRLGL